MQPLPDGRMPGMASAADLTRLRSLRGKQADVLWLQLMIAHHRGGIDMTKTALELTDRPSVRQLAQSIVDSQRAEITCDAGHAPRARRSPRLTTPSAATSSPFTGVLTSSVDERPPAHRGGSSPQPARWSRRPRTCRSPRST